MIRFCCDGCEQSCDQSSVTKIGRLEPAFYCATCLPVWRDFEALELDRRVKLVAAFEGWRLSKLADLRKTLKKLPDE